jgi:hypothetical protein
MIPYRPVSVVSLGGAYLLSSGRIAQWPAPSFLAAFVALWGIQFLAWATWVVILYPKLFSPLRGLPEPSGNSWFMGQLKAIRALPTGGPMIEWYVVSPMPPMSRHLLIIYTGLTPFQTTVLSAILAHSTKIGS